MLTVNPPNGSKLPHLIATKQSNTVIGNGVTVQTGPKAVGRPGIQSPSRLASPTSPPLQGARASQWLPRPHRARVSRRRGALGSWQQQQRRLPQTCRIAQGHTGGTACSLQRVANVDANFSSWCSSWIFCYSCPRCSIQWRGPFVRLIAVVCISNGYIFSTFRFKL